MQNILALKKKAWPWEKKPAEKKRLTISSIFGFQLFYIFYVS